VVVLLHHCWQHQTCRLWQLLYGQQEQRPCLLVLLQQLLVVLLLLHPV
jgi:hypothetical protein